MRILPSSVYSAPYLNSTPSNFQSALKLGRDGWSKGMPRVFKIDLDSSEVSNIKFIIDNLANKGWVKLLKLRKDLKKKGDQLDHVHPLSFFMTVVNTCYPHFRALKSRGGMPLNEFVGGAVESFHDERIRGNITDDQMRIFAQRTGRDFVQIKNFANSNNWEGFVKWL